MSILTPAAVHRLALMRIYTPEVIDIMRNVHDRVKSLQKNGHTYALPVKIGGANDIQIELYKNFVLEFPGEVK